MPGTTGPVHLVPVGLGNRTRKYLKYVEAHPEAGLVSAIVEPNPERLKQGRERYGLDAKDCYSSVEAFFSEHRDIDAVIIGTPDATHYDIALKAIAEGYHILLEKPVAETAQGCIEVNEAAARKGVIVCVCYVLRYHPFYIKFKEVLDRGGLGPIISVSHVENVGLDRMTHSYVRGLWSRSDQSSPMFLSKCCHDVDILLWLTGKQAAKVSSFGHLNWFRKENAPAGSAARCIDCGVEGNCPFSAVDLYDRRRDWIGNFIIPEGGTIDDAIAAELREGPLGRCVYRCDNNVVDHQVVALEMTDKTDIGISMDAFTQKDLRMTKIECAFGEIMADEQTLTVTHFRRDTREIFDFSEHFNRPLHGNADLNIVEDFLHAIRDPEHHKVRCPLEEAIESHLICFKAEDSRLQGRIMDM